MIRKNFLLLGLSLAAAVLLPGCTSDLQPSENDSGLPLRLSVSTETGLTRAADGLYTADTGFDGTESVEVFVNSSEKHATFTVGTPDGTHKSDLTGTLYYPTTGDANLYAVYPAASATNGSHTVKYDQTSDDNYKASDLMYAKKTVSQANKTNEQQLSFGHQLVKLKVKIIKAAGVTEVTKVEMKNVKRKVTVSADISSMTLGTPASAIGEAANAGNNEDKILIFQGNNTSTTEQTYAVVFPDQSWSNQDFITVTADNKEATYKLTKNDFTFGYEYTLTLNINAAALGNTVSIDTWTNGGSATISPTASELSIDIDDPTYTGSALMPAFTIKDANGTTVATVPVNTASSYGDFNIYWQNNTNAGTATVAAVGKTGTDYAGKACAKNFTINKAAQSVTLSPSSLTVAYQGSASTTVTRSGDGAITATSGNTSIATVNVSGTTVTVQYVATGSTTITVNVAESTNYKAASATLSVTCSSISVGMYLNKDGSVTSTQQTSGNNVSYARVCYVGSVPSYFDTFLAIALEDASSSYDKWGPQMSAANTWAQSHAVTMGGTTYNSCSTSAYDQVTSANTGTTSKPKSSGAVKGWRVPSVTDWKYIFAGIGGKAVDNSAVTDGIVYSSGTDSGASDGSHRALLNKWCGQAWNATTAPQAVQSGYYWSSSETAEGTDRAWGYNFFNSKFFWYEKTNYNDYVRACFAY